MFPGHRRACCAALTILIPVLLPVLSVSIGCDTTEPSGYRLVLTVTPQDTVYVFAGQSAVFDCLVTSDGKPLSREPIAVGIGRDAIVPIGSTDSLGHLSYVTRPVIAIDSSIAYSFVVTSGANYRSPVVRRTVIVRESTTPSVTIEAHGLSDDGTALPVPILPIVRTQYRRAIELLPRIFFAAGESAVDTRYRPSGKTPEFSIASDDELAVNHRLLDIVGARMRDDVSATLTLTGCNSNIGIEAANVILSRERSQSVRDYLRDTWQIDTARFTIESRDLPELPTEPAAKQGVEENRRVEFSSTSSRLLAPIEIDSVSDSISAVRVSFRTTVASAVAIVHWKVTADVAGRSVMQEMSGTGSPPSSILGLFSIGQSEVDQAVHYAIEIIDANGIKTNADGFTAVVPRTVNATRALGDGSVWFDYDLVTLNDLGEQYAQSLGDVASQARVGSLRISGHIADPESDETEADSRARAFALSIEQAVGSMPVFIDAQDPKASSFPGDLPEGRQLNRRAIIHFVQ
jgi:hypothetical protein